MGLCLVLPEDAFDGKGKVSLKGRKDERAFYKY